MKKIILCLLSLVFLSFNSQAKEINLECLAKMYEPRVGEENLHLVLLDTDNMKVGHNSASYELYSSTDSYFWKNISDYGEYYTERTYSISRTDLTFKYVAMSHTVYPQYEELIYSGKGTCKVIVNKNII